MQVLTTVTALGPQVQDLHVRKRRWRVFFSSRLRTAWNLHPFSPSPPRNSATASAIALGAGRQSYPIFTVFALVITYFGGATGRCRLSFHRVCSASLVSPVDLSIPLIALILGFDAIIGGTGARLAGSAAVHADHAGGIVAGQIPGAGHCAHAVHRIGIWSGGGDATGTSHTVGAAAYLGFMLSSVLLGLAFLSLAVMVSVFASDRTRASGLAIALWFLFVLVFDLLCCWARWY